MLCLSFAVLQGACLGVIWGTFLAGLMVAPTTPDFGTGNGLLIGIGVANLTLLASPVLLGTLSLLSIVPDAWRQRAKRVAQRLSVSLGLPWKPDPVNGFDSTAPDIDRHAPTVELAELDDDPVVNVTARLERPCQHCRALLVFGADATDIVASGMCPLCEMPRSCDVDQLGTDDSPTLDHEPPRRPDPESGLDDDDQHTSLQVMDQGAWDMAPLPEVRIPNPHMATLSTSSDSEATNSADQADGRGRDLLALRSTLEARVVPHRASALVPVQSAGAWQGMALNPLAAATAAAAAAAAADAQIIADGDCDAHDE